MKIVHMGNDKLHLCIDYSHCYCSHIYTIYFHNNNTMQLSILLFTDICIPITTVISVELNANFLPAIMNSQKEIDFISKAHRLFHFSMNYWIGGSTGGNKNRTVAFSEYNTSPGNMTVAY